MQFRKATVNDIGRLARFWDRDGDAYTYGVLLGFEESPTGDQWPTCGHGPRGDIEHFLHADVEVDAQLKTKPLFPITADARREGMCISLAGVLERAAQTCSRVRDGNTLAFSLQELQKHINQLREAKDDQDAARMLHGFLLLWVKK